MVIKKMTIILLLPMFLFSGCITKDELLPGPTGNRIVETSKREKRVFKMLRNYNEFKDLFEIEKIGDNIYNFKYRNTEIESKLNTDIDFFLETATEGGVLFYYGNYINKDDKYEAYHCYFDENKNIIKRLFDVSRFNYNKSLVQDGKVFHGGYDIGDYKIVELSSEGTKELFKIEDSPYVEFRIANIQFTITKDNLLVSYSLGGDAYLKSISLENNVITDIRTGDQNSEQSAEEAVISCYENNGIIFYCLGKMYKDSDLHEYELVEYSVVDKKIINTYPLDGGYMDLLTHGDTLVYTVPSDSGFGSTVFMAEKSDNEIRVIKTIDEATNRIISSYVDEEGMLFSTYEGIYKIDANTLEISKIALDRGRVESDISAVSIVDKKIAVITTLADGSRNYEYKTFEELENQYKSTKK